MNPFLVHRFQRIRVAGGIDPGEGILDDIYFETVTEQVFRGIPDTVLRRNSAYKDISHVQDPKDFAKTLPGGVHAFETAVLFF